MEDTMSRAMPGLLALSTLLISASSAFAQKEPPQTKEIKEAEKFVATAMITSDTTDRKSRFERALNPLQQAMVKDPGNARVWLVAGQVYAGLNDFARADSAYTKAQQLYPAYGEELATHRLRAWAAAFNVSVGLMDQRKYDEALVVLEAAERMYPERPESKMNLASIYANKADVARAEAMLRSVVELTNGPAKAKLKPEDAVAWERFSEMGTINLAQMVGQRGVEAFEKESYDDAAKAFREAHQLNPQARDYSYNLAQSLYAKARKVEEKRTSLIEQEKAARAKKDVTTANARAEEVKRLATDLDVFYTELEPLVVKSRTVDPNNEDLFLLQMRPNRVRADLSPTAGKAEFLKRADDLLRQHQALDVSVSDIAITPGQGEATIRGKLHNLKLTAGAPAKIHVTLLGLNGAVVGEQDAIVNAPAAQQSADFEMKAKLTGEMAAWKYEMRK
jgi:cytochrome c-type biogenesis protein CcmH/NrfG